MSTILPSVRTIPNWLTRALERDYFPGLEPYIAWLRQPVGWFVLATAASILVGVTIAPVALSLAAGLCSLLTIGLVYPWMAVRLARCELVSQLSHLEEDEAHDVQVQVHNRCPWPLWGLIIEGFVVNPVNDLDHSAEPSGDIALGCVPLLSQANYCLSIRPRLRGRYPLQSPQLTCAFPFGLWTARRNIDKVTPLVVHPKQTALVGVLEQSGRASHHCGSGSRTGGQGDFLGLRDYREGDSIRHIHWAHTARLDSLVVCERSAGEQALWHLVLSVGMPQTRSLLARENLAWRVRIAASLCTLLHQQSIAFHLTIQGEEVWSADSSHVREGSRLAQAIERLTDVPLDGLMHDQTEQLAPGMPGTAACRISIESVNEVSSGNENRPHSLVQVRMQRAVTNWRQSADSCEVIIDLDQPVAAQINAWLQRMSHGRHAA